MADYPCKTCTQVEDPQNCDRKLCKAWREWFLEKWEELRKGCGVNGKESD